MRAGLELTSIVSLVSVASLAGAAMVLGFPETGSQELEEISDRHGLKGAR
jgi:hypothetical protein